MKILTTTLIAFMLFASCGKHESKETENPDPSVDEIGASYLAQIAPLSVEVLFPDRCDRLTFLAQAAAFVKRFDLSGYEYPAGVFHRDVKPCYPGDSRSEISFDPLISFLHAALTTGDFAAVKRLFDYGEGNDWVFGEGPREYTYLPQMEIIINDMLANADLVKTQNSWLLESTHKQHILTISAWLKLRYAGFLEGKEILVLKALKPNPLLIALLARVDDGNQEKAIAYLKTFPATLPLEVGHENWGGCPKWLYFFLVKAMIDGK